MIADISLNVVSICFALSAIVLGIAAFLARSLALAGAALFAAAFFFMRV